MTSFEKLILNIKKGISGTGGLFGDLVETRPMPVRTLEPGDLGIADSDGNMLRQSTSPIAYDLWYLKHESCLLSQENISYNIIPQDYLDGPLSFLEDKLRGIKPLKIIQNIDDLVRDENDYWVGTGINPRWKNMGDYFIHLMAFEIWLYGLGEQFTSPGPETKYGFKRNDAVGYLSFPVGQLGVQEVISVFGSSEFDADNFSLEDNFAPNISTVSDFFFPPVDDYTGRNICYGKHLIESAYIVPDETRYQVEYLNATPFHEAHYSDVAPQAWMRWWIMKDDVFPKPGEFVGILLKPLALPPHIWWFQETNVILYAGNWFETGNLKGGIVTAVTLEVDRTDDGIGNQYTVEVEGREIIVNSSDFLTYAVGDRVGILKVDSVLDAPKTSSKGDSGAFFWGLQTRINTSDIGTKYESTKYQILPIEFYNN